MVYSLEINILFMRSQNLYFSKQLLFCHRITITDLIRKNKINYIQKCDVSYSWTTRYKLYKKKKKNVEYDNEFMTIHYNTILTKLTPHYQP